MAMYLSFLAMSTNPPRSPGTHPGPPSDLLMLDRPGGSVAIELHGQGPLVVCLPGMGDLRSTFRSLAPALVGAGFRVATMDLRGHGDSTATFDDYGDVATASDLIALLDHLGCPAVVVGSSMGAGAAVVAAAERPDRIRGLVLVGPFVRQPRVSPLMSLAFRAAMARPWAVRVWERYVPTLYAGRRPDDLDEHIAAIVATLRHPAHARAFRLTTRTSHAPAEAALPDAAGRPTLVIMGRLDPDFPDPAAEARWIADQLDGETLLVEDAGHYPHAQRPDLVNQPIIELARRALRHA